MDSKNDQKYQAMLNTFKQPNPHSHGVYKMLMGIYPALAKKIFEKNGLMETVVMSNLNPMNILDYYVCARCEALAAQDGVIVRNKQVLPKCTCRAKGCGHTTVNPPTLRDWMIDEIKHKAPPDVAEMAEYVVDVVAMRLLGQAMNDYKKIASGVQEEQQGLIVPTSGMSPTSKRKVTFDKIADDNQIADNNALWEKLNNKEKK